MLCNRVLSAVNLWAGHIRRQTEVARIRYICGGLNTTDLCPYLSNYKLGRKRTMMVDCGETARGPAVDALPEKDDDGGYASGGWSSEDGRLSCGYASFRGKRASMEDFYDIKATKIDGQSVSLFGIFDGQLLSYKYYSTFFLKFCINCQRNRVTAEGANRNLSCTSKEMAAYKIVRI